jgi:excisionase family DNA binding protein
MKTGAKKLEKTDLEDLITQAEAARIRGVSREAIYDLVARGKLKVRQIGGQKFVQRSEVENYEPQAGGRPPGPVSAKPEKRSATGRR